MEVPVLNKNGQETGTIVISDYVFGVEPNETIVHQAVVRQLANARQGTASTKTRSEVAGSTKKLYRQKGTGNARAGSAKSGTRRGGGAIFGPKPRNYRQSMPRKMRQLALRCVLSAKASDKELVVIDEFALEQPSTKEMAGILNAVGIDKSALIVTAEVESNVVKSARNIPGMNISPANLLNVVDILAGKKLVMTVGAVRKAEEIWGEETSKGGSDASVRSA
ncbi:MAG: 50S ribosomal protein L4 [Dehalococcoidales bacterium]|nr:50S ribosomal protein L4 [Dehalococcoidales bacterium]